MLMKRRRAQVARDHEHPLPGAGQRAAKARDHRRLALAVGHARDQHDPLAAFGSAKQAYRSLQDVVGLVLDPGEGSAAARRAQAPPVGDSDEYR